MATIGQSLTAPETGWKRYDDADSRMLKVGTWNIQTAQTGYYQTTRIYTSVVNDYIKFKFYGSKIRIIGDILGSNYRDTVAELIIDGVSEQVTLTTASATSITPTFLVLQIEKLNLNLGFHEVILKKIDTYSGRSLLIDAIDIDATGYLVHPILNQKSSLMDITNKGDIMPCRYTATSGAVGTFSEFGICDATPIPVASTATPDGSFYWIFVGYDYRGRMKFVADRNIQHTISWDTLNNAGVASGEGLSISDMFRRVNSNALTHTLQAGTVYSGTANMVSDGFVSSTNSGNFVVSGATTNVGFVSIDYITTKVITKLVLRNTLYSTWATMYPKNFKLQGSNEGGTNSNAWTDVYTGVTSSSSIGTVDTFKFSNTTGYRYYRIYVIDNWGYASYLSIADIEMYESDIPYDMYSFNIRLLTGGTSATDKDNEWDKIVVESTLGGAITAGDNNVWNWSGSTNASYSWTSTTSSASGNTYRVVRGKTAKDGYAGNTTPTADCAFRPVLIVDSSPFYRYLIKSGANVYTIKPYYGDIGVYPPTESQFINIGFSDINKLTSVFKDGKAVMTSDGAMGSGKQFSVDLFDGMTSTKEIIKG